jgi:hypothetical protein
MSLFEVALVVIAVAAVSICALWLARRSPLNDRFSSEVGEHDKAFDFLGTAFAVLLAFVVIQAYTSYNDAKTGAEREATGVLQLSRSADAFTPREHARLEGLLICYGRAVIHLAWPLMQEKEEASPVVNAWGSRFREAVQDVRLDSAAKRETFRQLLTEQDDRIEGRRIRLAEAVRTVPEPMWFVLLLGAALTIGWVVLAAGRRGSFLVQASVTASVAAMIASALLLVWFLDHPFSNSSGSITPIEMEHAIETIKVEQEGATIPVTAPCTEEGRPLT